MKAIVLAAGQSKRLYPLTEQLPKCLLPIGGKTILDHQIEALVAHGIDEIVIVVGCKEELIREHLATRSYPIRITYVVNENYATTQPVLGGLALAREHLTEPVLFFHCDVLFNADAVGALLADETETTLLYREGVWDEEAGKIVVVNGRVVELGKHIEKANATGEYLQLAKFGPAFLTALDSVLEERIRERHDGFTIDAFNEVVQSVVATALPFTGLAIEIDTPEDYRTAQKAWQERA